MKRFAFLCISFILLMGLVQVASPGYTAQANPQKGANSSGTDGDTQLTGPSVASSTPKLFWYERTFGVTEVPYLADTTHIFDPEGITLDSSGNLWVAETLGGRVLKYDPEGTFLMSIGTAGRAWLADNTHISLPIDVGVDGDGNIWVVDQNSHRVVKYDADGDYLIRLGITWEAGADNAHFSNPRGIAFDSSGYIYVSDSWNHRVQVFDSTGFYSTTIGVTGVAGTDDDHFNYPGHIAIDVDGNLYVADQANHRVQIFDNNHNYVATMGVTGVPGYGNDYFNIPMGVAVDATQIYVSDSTHRVKIFNRTTRVLLETLGSGGSDDYQFDWPQDVAVDTAGNLYVADSLNHRVQKFNHPLLIKVGTFGTTRVPYLTDSYHYDIPSGVAVDKDGNIGIVEDDQRGHRFVQLDPDGTPQFTIGEPGIRLADDAHLANPRNLTYDLNGNIYIADEWNNRIQIFTGNGVYSNTLGTGWGTGPYQFKNPDSVAVDSSGNIYVADTVNQRIQIYDSTLTYSATLGETGVPGSDDYHFNDPEDVEVDTDGNIYVVDTFNNRVQKYDNNRVWQMTVDGFWGANAIAVDSKGNIYVASFWTNRVDVFQTNGAYMTTIGGSFGSQVDQFRHPTGVAVDADGNVYIADKDNQRIQKYAPGSLQFLPVVARSTP